MVNYRRTVNMITDEINPLQSPFSHIPQGVADYFWDEARRRTQLTGLILSIFRQWGYGDVIPPMFEQAEIMNARTGRSLQSEMYRLQDRDGNLLVLRADMTIPVARLVGTRLHDRPMPQRFCYAGSVFRQVDETHAGRQREFSQAGLELIGAAGPQADAEILALTGTTLAMVGLSEYKLAVGHLRYFHGLLQNLELQPEQRCALQQAIDRNSEAELAEFLRSVPLRTQQRRTLEEFLQLSGEDGPAVIDRAERLCLNHTMHEALVNLRAIYAGLQVYGMADRVYVDLTEINDLGYYSGLTFEALAPELGSSIAGGGRYDNLIATFGPSRPAVGVALGIDRILFALHRQADQRIQGHPVPPVAVVSTGNDPTCMTIVTQWRRAGLSIATDVCNSSGAELWAMAQEAGTPFVLEWQGGGFHIFADKGIYPADFLEAHRCHEFAAILRGATRRDMTDAPVAWNS